MTVIFMESGGGGPGTTGFWAVTGTGVGGSAATVNTTTPPSGTDRSILLEVGTTPTSVFLRRTGVLADSGRRGSFYARWSDATPGTTSQFLAPRNGSSAEVWYLQLTTGGNVRLRTVGVADVKTGATVLANDTWYRISFAYAITSVSNYTFKVWINGALEFTAVGGVDANIGIGAAELGLIAHSSLGASQSVRYAHVVVDDGNTLDDIGAEGGTTAAWVTPKRPIANGANQGFDTTTSTSNSGYGTGNAIYVNEIPVATTGARRLNGASATGRDDYQVEAAATTIDISGRTIVAICGWVHGAGMAASNDDRIVLDNASAIPSTVCGPFTSGGTIRWRILTQATYPHSNAVGMERVTGHATEDAVLNECGVLVFTNVTPSVPSNDTSRLLLLRAG